MEHGRSYISKIKKIIFLWLTMGMIYFTLEGIWRGWTHGIMIFIGGLCGVLVGELNEFPQFYKLKMWQQCIIGTIIILVIEFISGMILNVYLGLGIWNYDSVWGNVYGQICIPYALLWFILVPFNVYIDDYLRCKFFNELMIGGLIDNYINLVKRK